MPKSRNDLSSLILEGNNNNNNNNNNNDNNNNNNNNSNSNNIYSAHLDDNI